MTKTVYRTRNWSSYNTSLKTRGSLNFWLSPEIMMAWKGHKILSPKPHGNQRHTDEIITFSLTIRQLFRLPLRATEGFVKSLATLMNLDLKTPDYSTLSRRSQHLKISLEHSSQEKKRHVLVDSTGVRVFGEGEWKVRQHGRSKRRLWRKLHIAMDEEDQMILSSEVTESQRHDGAILPLLIERIEGALYQITGDGAYDKKSCYRAAYKRGAKPVFPPQRDAIVQRNKHKKDPALIARDDVVKFMASGQDYKEQRKVWKQETGYHRRSLVENMMWRMKTLFGDEMRARSFANQQTDLLIRCYAMNLINTLGLPQSTPIT